MIRIAIVDDRKEMRDLIYSEVENVLFKCEYEYAFDLYENGKKLIDIVLSQNIKYDIILLDIEMPEISGLEISKSLVSYCSNTAVIFITSHKEFIVDAFGFNVFGFINKDELHDKIEGVILSLLKFSDKLKTVLLKTVDGFARYPLTNIIAFTLESRKLYMYLSNGEKLHIYVNTLSEVKEMLRDNLFINFSRAALVNLRYVESTKNLKASIIGRSDITFDISESKKSLIDKMLLQMFIGD